MVGGPLRKCAGWGRSHLKSPLAPQPVPLKLDSMPHSKGPFSANIHPIVPKLSVPIPEGMRFRKMVWSPLRKCTGWGKKSIWNHPYHPNRYHWNLIQCHLLRAHSPRIYIWSFPNFLCLYLRACAFWKWCGPPSKMHGLGSKIHLKSPLAPQPVPLKFDSMPPSKGPFSANIHPIIPKLFVPIPEGICVRKMVGGFFENAWVGVKNPLEITLSTPVGITETWFNATF